MVLFIGLISLGVTSVLLVSVMEWRSMLTVARLRVRRSVRRCRSVLGGLLLVGFGRRLFNGWRRPLLELGGYLRALLFDYFGLGV